MQLRHTHDQLLAGLQDLMGRLGPTAVDNDVPGPLPGPLPDTEPPA